MSGPDATPVPDPAPRSARVVHSLGALPSFVRQQFRIESGILGFAGSALGVLSGALIACLHAAAVYGPGIALFALRGEGGFLALALPGAFAAGIALSILAAVYPAMVAARMIPADALRTNI